MHHHPLRNTQHFAILNTHHQSAPHRTVQHIKRPLISENVCGPDLTFLALLYVFLHTAGVTAEEQARAEFCNGPLYMFNFFQVQLRSGPDCISLTHVSPIFVLFLLCARSCSCISSALFSVHSVLCFVVMFLFFLFQFFHCEHSFVDRLRSASLFGTMSTARQYSYFRHPPRTLYTSLINNTMDILMQGYKLLLRPK